MHLTSLDGRQSFCHLLYIELYARALARSCGDTHPNKQVYMVVDCRVASKMEWRILYVLAREEEGMLSIEAARCCFDGSLFVYCAKMNEEGEAKMS